MAPRRRAGRRFAAICVLAATACSGGGTEPPGPPSGLTVLAAVPASVPAGTPLPDSVRVRVTDASGRPVPNVTVRWTVGAGFGTVRPSENLTDPAGTARVEWTVWRTVGEQRLTATILTATGTAAQTLATRVVPGPVSVVRLSPTQARLVVGETRQFSATAWDAYGNTVTGRPVNWATAHSSVAAVDGTGTVTARGAGATEVTATMDGTVARAPVTVTPEVVSGSEASLQFDGDDEYAQAPDHSALRFGTGDFTWEAWVKRQRTGTREDILSKKDLLGDSEHDVVLLVETDGRANAFLRDHPYVGSTVIVSSASRVGTDWTHLAMTRAEGVVRLYVNGVLEGTGSAPFSVSSTGPFRMGANRANNAGADAAPLFPFAGRLRDVRVWSVARTAAQVREGMTRCPTAATPGLVAHFPLDDRSGRTARDVSASGNHAALRNGPVWVAGASTCGGT